MRETAARTSEELMAAAVAAAAGTASVAGAGKEGAGEGNVQGAGKGKGIAVAGAVAMAGKREARVGLDVPATLRVLAAQAGGAGEPTRLEVGSAIYCSPRHRMPLKSRLQGSKWFG